MRFLSPTLEHTRVGSGYVWDMSAIRYYGWGGGGTSGHLNFDICRASKGQDLTAWLGAGGP